jgi:hypothetical protein
MAGSPLKRARKQDVRLDDGTIIAFSYMPHVAELPARWRHFSTAQKIEHLVGLDRCYEILSWPLAGRRAPRTRRTASRLEAERAARKLLPIPAVTYPRAMLLLYSAPCRTGSHLLSRHLLLPMTRCM